MKSKFFEDVGIDVENVVKGSGGGVGISFFLYLDISVFEIGRNDKGIWGIVGVIEELFLVEFFLLKKYGVEGNFGNVFCKWK